MAENIFGGSAGANRYFGSGFAAVATGSNEHANMDRIVLKQLMVRDAKFFTSGSKVVRALRMDKACFVMVDGTLSDMTGPECVAEIRAKVPGLEVPILMVSLETRKDFVVNSVRAGCTGFVVRPYSLQVFEERLKRSLAMLRANRKARENVEDAKAMHAQGKTDKAIENLENVVKDEAEAQKRFDQGLKSLMEGDYDEAIASLSLAVNLNTLFAEAHNGLAKAYKAKGKDRFARTHLSHAAECYARQDKHESVKKVFAEIYLENPNAPNPYNTMGMRLKAQGDIDGALEAYFKARELTPNDEHLLFNIANAYLFKRHINKAAAYLGEALLRNPGFDRAKALFKKITGREWKPI